MTPEDRLTEIRRRVEAFAAERGYQLSENQENILKDLVRMHDRFGDFYCPCQPTRGSETVCVCSAAKNGLVELEGACFCGLVLLPEQSSEE